MTSGDGGDPKALLNNSTFSVKTWSLGSPILSEAHHTLEQALLSTGFDAGLACAMAPAMLAPGGTSACQSPLGTVG